MTCIKFYQGLPHHPATSYTDLYSRLHYLQDAFAHLEAERKHQLSKKGTLAMVTSSLQKTMGESSEDKSRMTVTPTELTSYMNTITLQIDVTQFMHNCFVEGTLRQRKERTKKFGTLFDNASVKCDVVSKVRWKCKDCMNFKIECLFKRDQHVGPMSLQHYNITIYNIAKSTCWSCLNTVFGNIGWY